jgi:hypothetical protein
LVGGPPLVEVQNGMSSGSASSVAASPGWLGSLARGLGPVLDVDAVQLERDALVAVASDVLARLGSDR